MPRLRVTSRHRASSRSLPRHSQLGAHARPTLRSSAVQSREVGTSIRESSEDAMELLVCSKCGAEREGGRVREGDVCGVALRPSLWTRMFRSRTPWKHCTGQLQRLAEPKDPLPTLDTSTFNPLPTDAGTCDSGPTPPEFGGAAGSAAAADTPGERQHPRPPRPHSSSRQSISDPCSSRATLASSISL
jgi:hypothetical protein